MGKKDSLTKRAHDAILRHLGGLHVNEVMEEMGYDLDDMPNQLYNTVKDAVEIEMTFICTLIERN